MHAKTIHQADRGQSAGRAGRARAAQAERGPRRPTPSRQRVDSAALMQPISGRSLARSLAVGRTTWENTTELIIGTPYQPCSARKVRRTVSFIESINLKRQKVRQTNRPPLPASSHLNAPPRTPTMRSRGHDLPTGAKHVDIRPRQMKHTSTRPAFSSTPRRKRHCESPCRSFATGFRHTADRRHLPRALLCPAPPPAPPVSWPRRGRAPVEQYQ